MPKNETPQRIEAVFENTGLGNTDPEKILEFQEAYERAMAQAERLRNRKGKNFKKVFEEATAATDESKQEKS